MNALINALQDHNMKRMDNVTGDRVILYDDESGHIEREDDNKGKAIPMWFILEGSSFTSIKEAITWLKEN